MPKLPKHYRGFITYSRKDKSKAKRLHKALERYRVPRGIAFEGSIKGRKLGRFFRDSDEMETALDLGDALKGALADSECLIAICSPQAAASVGVEREIIQFTAAPEHGPVLPVIVKGKPNVAASPNPRKAARECLPAALKPKIDPRAKPRKESLARTRARIAAALLHVPFDEVWRRDRGRAWVRRLIFGAGAVCIVGALAFGALAVTGLALRYANAVRATETAASRPNANVVAATALACEASVESLRAWDAALQTGMRTNEYREMEKLGSAFKEAMYVCAATAAHKPTEQDARALCDRLNDATAPEIPANATDAYAEAMGMMSEQLQAVKSSCAQRLAPGSVTRSSQPSDPAPPVSASATR